MLGQGQHGDNAPVLTQKRPCKVNRHWHRPNAPTRSLYDAHRICPKHDTRVRNIAPAPESREEISHDTARTTSSRAYACWNAISELGQPERGIRVRIRTRWEQATSLIGETLDRASVNNTAHQEKGVGRAGETWTSSDPTATPKSRLPRIKVESVQKICVIRRASRTNDRIRVVMR